MQEGCTLVDIQCSWSHSSCIEPLCCDPLSSLISPSCPARGCISKLQKAIRSFLLAASYRTARSALAQTSLNLLFLLPQETSHLGIWLWPPETGLSKPLPGRIWSLKLRNLKGTQKTSTLEYEIIMALCHLQSNMTLGLATWLALINEYDMTLISGDDMVILFNCVCTLGLSLCPSDCRKKTCPK